jgi:hypothetical protein
VIFSSSYRKDLGLVRNGSMNLVEIDEMLILTPPKQFGDAVPKKIDVAMKRK